MLQGSICVGGWNNRDVGKKGMRSKDKECAGARRLFAESKGFLPLLAVEEVGPIDVAEQGEREGIFAPPQAYSNTRGWLSSNRLRYFGRS